jgi:cytochrome P450
VVAVDPEVVMSIAQERSPSQPPVLDADFLQDPHFWRSRELGDAPAQQVRMPSGLAVWLVTKYEEAKLALSDPRFSKDAQQAGRLIESKLPPGGERREFESSLASHMLNMDPPDHTRLRKLVVKAFTARRVEALRPRVEEITARLLDRMADSTEVDLLDALAFPLPIQVICELLGVDESRRDEFRAWSNALIGTSDQDTIREAGMNMAGYLAELVAAKRQQPADDLVSALIEVSEDEDRLSERELIGMMFLLLIAGHETTVNLIGNCVLALLTNPEQFAAVRENPDLVADAIEETLRFNGPVNLATMRHTTEAVRLGDVEIPAGEVVFVSLHSANRDGDRFDAPNRFDLDRVHSGHLGFGYGIHFCVGAQLARMEAQVALRRLLERFPNLAPAQPTDTLRWRHSMIMRGLEKLPVRLR